MTLLFVCSGNTCRSPLALAAWRMLCGSPARMGLNLAAPLSGDIRVASAGVTAANGASAATFTQMVAAEWGQDLSAHRSRQVTAAILSGTDMVLTMSAQHADFLRAHFPASGDKIHLLGSFEVNASLRDLPRWLLEVDPEPAASGDVDILDPYGGSLEAYQACGGQILRCVIGLARHLAGNQL